MSGIVVILFTSLLTVCLKLHWPSRGSFSLDFLDTSGRPLQRSHRPIPQHFPPLDSPHLAIPLVQQLRRSCSFRARSSSSPVLLPHAQRDYPLSVGDRARPSRVARFGMSCQVSHCALDFGPLQTGRNPSQSAARRSGSPVRHSPVTWIIDIPGHFSQIRTGIATVIRPRGPQRASFSVRRSCGVPWEWHECIDAGCWGKRTDDLQWR